MKVELQRPMFVGATLYEAPLGVAIDVPDDAVLPQDAVLIEGGEGDTVEDHNKVVLERQEEALKRAKAARLEGKRKALKPLSAAEVEKKASAETFTPPAPKGGKSAAATA